MVIFRLSMRSDVEVTVPIVAVPVTVMDPPVTVKPPPVVLIPPVESMLYTATVEAAARVKADVTVNPVSITKTLKLLLTERMVT